VPIITAQTGGIFNKKNTKLLDRSLELIETLIQVNNHKGHINEHNDILNLLKTTSKEYNQEIFEYL
jgi:hypothetical protein